MDYYQYYLEQERIMVSVDDTKKYKETMSDLTSIHQALVVYLKQEYQ